MYLPGPPCPNVRLQNDQAYGTSCPPISSQTQVPGTKAHETKAPKEIPPEAIQEYMDIMDELFGPINFVMWESSCLSTGEPAANLGEEGLHQNPLEDDLYPDASVLSYTDEGFVDKVETMIDPHFLEELLPSEPHINFMDITKEPEQQEEVTPDQVKRGWTVSQQTRGWRYTGCAREAGTPEKQVQGHWGPQRLLRNKREPRTKEDQVELGRTSHQVTGPWGQTPNR
ncbi:NUT family member 2A [Sciurus carolinensis]|uniref:NUT family member 2A n=1 Tax=Sciurus carolinensis TaxID=30640 RepID=A0AA41T1D4_SCICA|nr:NUT family member 2A [Sciurus carolinensis]